MKSNKNKENTQTHFIGNRSFFVRFCLSYLLILTIPLMTITFSYYTSQKAIRQEILHSGSVVTEKTFSELDQKLGNMMQTLLQISLNSKTASLINMPKDDISQEPYRLLEIKQYMSTLMTKEYSDIFLYHKPTDTIISAENSSLDSRLYYETYLSKKQSYDEWHERLNSRNVRATDIFYNKDNTATLALYQSFPLNNLKDASITTGIIMKPSALTGLISAANIGNESAILIFGENTKQLFSTDKTYDDITLPSDYDETTLYTSAVNGHEYVMKCYSSKMTQCTYAFIIPTCVFWQKLTSLNLILIISISLCLFLSILLTFALAKRNYKPLKKMLSFVGLKANRQYNRKKETETDFIQTAFEQVFVEKEDLNKRLEKEQTALREEYLFKVMQGIIHDNDKLSDSFLQYGIEFISDLFCVALFDVGTNEGIISVVIEQINSKMPDGYLLITARTSANTVACIFNCPVDKEPQPLLIKLCKTTVDYLTSCLNSIVSCGIGTLQYGIAGIHQTYIEALHAISYDFVFGKGECIVFSQIEDRKFCYHYDETAQAEQILLQYLRDFDEQSSALKCFDDIMFRFLGDNLPTQEMVKCFKHDLTRLINKVIGEVNAVKLEKERNIIERLIATETFAEFKALAVEELTQINIFCRSSKGYSELVNKVIAYINENYWDINLNVNTLGESMKISPSYLSKLFRDDTRIKIWEYITSVRIAKAKLLLLETSYNIEEIAKQSGFLDSSALVRSFKKFEGVTPGSFRKLRAADLKK